MEKGGGSETTIIIGPSKSVLVYALHSLENVLDLARFRVFVPNMYVMTHYLVLLMKLRNSVKTIPKYSFIEKMPL